MTEPDAPNWMASPVDARRGVAVTVVGGRPTSRVSVLVAERPVEPVTRTPTVWVETCWKRRVIVGVVPPSVSYVPSPSRSHSYLVISPSRGGVEADASNVTSWVANGAAGVAASSGVGASVEGSSRKTRPPEVAYTRFWLSMATPMAATSHVPRSAPAESYFDTPPPVTA